VKFTPDNGQIGIEAKKINDKEVQVRVWDTGIGIEKKDASKIFAEFEQIDSEYSRKYAGTGLGMPLSKKFVELHGGKMWFESEGVGAGTRFYFTLPMTQPDKK
jgi:signal transduction histidine kinase